MALCRSRRSPIAVAVAAAVVVVVVVVVAVPVVVAAVVVVVVAATVAVADSSLRRPRQVCVRGGRFGGATWPFLFPTGEYIRRSAGGWRLCSVSLRRCGE